ncbi:unnamed protein product [Absidia cylindrospora]
MMNQAMMMTIGNDCPNIEEDVDIAAGRYLHEDLVNVNTKRIGMIAANIMTIMENHLGDYMKIGHPLTDPPQIGPDQLLPHQIAHSI